MTALDYILDGLEAELTLERELGIRSVEIDRALLRGMQDAVGSRVEQQDVVIPAVARQDVAPPGVARQDATPPVVYDFVFLHERPLSPKGVEMMAKIVVAMGRTAETAPVIFTDPLPAAKAYVVLGGLSLRKWFPGRNVAPGTRFKTEQGIDVLVTYSPEYILRFGTVTPAVKKIKQDMWLSLKDLMRRF